MGKSPQLPEVGELYSNGSIGLDESSLDLSKYEREEKKEKSGLGKYLAIAGGTIGGIIVGGALALKLLSSPGVYDSNKPVDYKANTHAVQTETLKTPYAKTEKNKLDDKPYWIDEEGWAHIKPNAKIERRKDGYDNLLDAFTAGITNPEFDLKYKIVEVDKKKDDFIVVGIELASPSADENDKRVVSYELYGINEKGKYYFQGTLPWWRVIDPSKKSDKDNKKLSEAN